MPNRDRTTLPGADLDDLLREVLSRVHGGLDEQARLRLLLDAVVSVAADLSLDGVLARIVTAARELAGARYAALGVLDFGAGRGLRMFVHHGMDPVQVEQIGALPTGHGLLGLLIDHPEPLRLHDIAEHPQSYGFPADHPPMSSFLGVPIRIRDQVFGNLYLTEKEGEGDFTPQDEDVVIALAAAAGVAIENARLYEEAGRREDWLEATAEIAGVLSGAVTVDTALDVIADRARQVAAADVSWIVVQGDGGPSLRAVSGTTVSLDELQGLSLDDSFSERVAETGDAMSVDDVTGGGHAESSAHARGWPDVGPAIIVPLRTGDVVAGALALGWSRDRADRYHEVDPRLPAGFAEQAALALRLVRSRDAEQRLAVLEDRDRIGRDLHDLVIQRLFAVGLGLQNVSRLSDAAPFSDRLESAVRDLDATIQDIRRTIFALGSSSDAADLQTEVTRLVDRAAATLKFRPTLSLEGPVRSLVTGDRAPHLLAVLGEALSNASRHADASTIAVTIRVGEGLELVVADDGRGLPDDVHESGLRHMRDRATQLRGTCVVESSAQGTTVTWTVPLT